MERGGVSAYPDLPEAWYGLGKAYLSHGALAGLDSGLQAADDSFRHGWRLDSTPLGDAALGRSGAPVVEELLRMVEYAHLRGNAAEVRRLALRALAADSTSDLAQALRWHLAETEGDSARRAFWTGIESVGEFGVGKIRLFITWTGVGAEDFARAEAEDARRLRAHDPGFGKAVRLARALNGGRPAEALQITDARGTFPGAEARFRVIEALSWGGDSAAAREAIEQLSPFAAAPPVDGPNALPQNFDVCVVARWRAAHGDFSGTEAASRRLALGDPSRSQRIQSDRERAQLGALRRFTGRRTRVATRPARRDSQADGR